MPEAFDVVREAYVSANAKPPITPIGWFLIALGIPVIAAGVAAIIFAAARAVGAVGAAGAFLIKVGISRRRPAIPPPA